MAPRTMNSRESRHFLSEDIEWAKGHTSKQLQVWIIALLEVLSSANEDFRHGIRGTGKFVASHWLDIIFNEIRFRKAALSERPKRKKKTSLCSVVYATEHGLYERDKVVVECLEGLSVEESWGHGGGSVTRCLVILSETCCCGRSWHKLEEEEDIEDRLDEEELIELDGRGVNHPRSLSFGALVSEVSRLTPPPRTEWLGMILRPLAVDYSVKV